MISVRCMNEAGVPKEADYPNRLQHGIPSWVSNGAWYHVRIRAARHQQTPLTDDILGDALLGSIRHYHAIGRWHCLVCVVMPDHLHAILSFPADKRLIRVVGEWKRYHAKRHGITWQDNFFDHRLRNEAQVFEKYRYILNNPVAKGLCERAEDWPWWSAHST
jgi:REP element-mobilizing transposase RayT